MNFPVNAVYLSLKVGLNDFLQAARIYFHNYLWTGYHVHCHLRVLFLLLAIYPSVLQRGNGIPSGHYFKYGFYFQMNRPD